MTESGCVTAIAPPRQEAPFTSILWPDAAERHAVISGDTMRDLGLGRIVEALVVGAGSPMAAGHFHRLPLDQDTVVYRQDVIEDAERPDVRGALTRFTDAMGMVRSRLVSAGKVRYGRQRDALALEGSLLYFRGIVELRQSLHDLEPRSQGLTSWRGFLDEHTRSAAFSARLDETEALAEDLSQLRYTLRIPMGRVHVENYEEETDAAAAVAGTFARFRQREGGRRFADLVESPWLSHVEQEIIDRIALLAPEVFARLDGFARRHARPLDPVVVRFDEEIRFFLSYLDLIAPLVAAGLKFCRPSMSPQREIDVDGAFDLALADSLSPPGRGVVLNDVRLHAPERVIVVSGPNQGGKTTYARMFGQLHVLGALGLPVPARQATLLLADSVLTHFERQEQVADQRSRLEDDLLRVRSLLEGSTDRTVLVLNEAFTSTTLEDSRVLGEKVLRKILGIGAMCVYVTFVDELASLDPSVVSMMSTVEPDDPATRTFRVVRKPADGRAHAISLAAKYGLTREQIVRRQHR